MRYYSRGNYLVKNKSQADFDGILLSWRQIMQQALHPIGIFMKILTSLLFLMAEALKKE